MDTFSQNYQAIQQQFYSKDFRQRCRYQPKTIAKELELNQAAVKFVFNTKETTYIPLPYIGTDINLTEISAAGPVSVGASTVSSASSAGTAFTLSCPSVTISSASSAGTAASAGSVKGT